MSAPIRRTTTLSMRLLLLGLLLRRPRTNVVSHCTLLLALCAHCCFLLSTGRPSKKQHVEPVVPAVADAPGVRRSSRDRRGVNRLGVIGYHRATDMEVNDPDIAAAIVTSKTAAEQQQPQQHQQPQPAQPAKDSEGDALMNAAEFGFTPTPPSQSDRIALTSKRSVMPVTRTSGTGQGVGPRTVNVPMIALANPTSAPTKPTPKRKSADAKIAKPTRGNTLKRRRTSANSKKQ